MDDFTQFDAFERCREFTRVIAGHLRNGVFSKDPVLTTALWKTLLSVYSDIRGRKFKNRDSDHPAPKSRKPPR
jgi:hypothetical protein